MDHDMLVDRSDEAMESVENRRSCIAKAICFMLLGTAISAAFAEPLVDAMYNFSQATHIRSFFVSFVLLPFVTNSSDAYDSVVLTHRKKKRITSLTFSQIYGTVTMKNILCLGVFLTLVYVRDLTWDFSSELLIIMLVCLTIGLFSCCRTTFPLWTCVVPYMLYPLSLVIIHVLDSVYNLS